MNVCNSKLDFYEKGNTYIDEYFQNENGIWIIQSPLGWLADY